MKPYQPSDIEPKWQNTWEQTKLYRALDDDVRQKFYYLVEFPYPSGDGLHVGHVRSYTALDIMARLKRMQGFNVLYPMGFDAFGLPTENYAIKHKIPPQQATATNVANFERQLKALGLSFDWERRVNTTDPDYYRWTQWIFLQLLDKGLAYQAEIPINWCPFEKTGLANEEVVNGRHERCGTLVEKKLLKQWMLKITAYADRLIEDLKTVDYSDRIVSQQVNWIGRSEGAQVNFKVEDSDVVIEVFTTRIDTLFSGTFLVLAPEHPLVAQLTVKEEAVKVDAYIKQTQHQTEVMRQETDRPKTGAFTGSFALNPANGVKMPIWIADFVLASYGTGAVFADGHDERDVEFAAKYDIPIKTSLEPITGKPQPNEEFRSSIVAIVRDPKTDRVLTINWGDKAGGRLFVGGGRDGDEDIETTARREILEETGYRHLRLIGQTERIHHHYVAHSKASQKRYIHAWGILFELDNDEQTKPKLEADEKGKFKVEWINTEQAATQVKDELHHYVFTSLVRNQPYTGEGILYNSEQFDGLTSQQAKPKITAWLEEKGLAKKMVNYKLRDWIFSRQHYWGEPIPVVHCAKDGVVPVPEDQLPVTLPEVEFYEPTETGESPLAAITDWVNTTCSKCGGPAKRETDTMPNWAGSSWYFLRYIDPHNDQAFADPDKLKYWLQVDLYNGGMEHTTLHLLYSRFWHKFLFDQGLVPTPEPYARRRSHGMVLAPDGRKMSKSIGNVINPDQVIERYGTDAVRLYEMFMGPFEDETAWSDERLNGVSRFLYRVWTLAQDLMANTVQTEVSDGVAGEVATAVDRQTHKTLKKVGHDIETMHFNTMVSSLMEYVNFLTAAKTRTELLKPDNANVARRTLRTLILMLAPAIPHMTEELWQQLGEAGSVHVAGWPKYDPALIKDELIEIVVQVNGKLRANLVLPVDASEDELVEAAKADAHVAEYLSGGDLIKTIVVPRKLVNFVVK
jgi:leucyl-tRNA synthetase